MRNFQGIIFFHMKTNIKEDLQFCITVLLIYVCLGEYNALFR